MKPQHKKRGGLAAAPLTSLIRELLGKELPQGFEVQTRRTSAESWLLS
jgi:hypothetical protein